MTTTTTPDQSTRLLTAGVPAYTADCSYIKIGEQTNYYIGKTSINAAKITQDGKVIAQNVQLHSQPSWSLAPLVALLPKTIPHTEKDPQAFDYGESRDYDLYIYPRIGEWIVHYIFNEDYDCHPLYCSSHPDLLEAVVRMIETLVTHHHPLNLTLQ